MLNSVVGDRPHALGDCLVLTVNTLDPTEDRILLLRGAVDLPIVTWIGRQPEASEPVRRVRQKFVAAFCAADRPSVLEYRLRLRHRRHAAFPPKEEEHRMAVVKRPPSPSIHIPAEFARRLLGPERKHEVPKAPIGVARAGWPVGCVLRAPGGIGDVVLRGT